MSCAAAGEPFGKAGAYGIQGPAGCWVKHLEGEASCHVTENAVLQCSSCPTFFCNAGSYFNVVGFPLHAFANEVKSLVTDGLLKL